jgi:hypothetical protein
MEPAQERRLWAVASRPLATIRTVLANAKRRKREMKKLLGKAALGLSFVAGALFARPVHDGHGSLKFTST